MESLHIAEHQLNELKLLFRDIRRSLLAKFPGQLPGHRRFLDSLATALGYSSFSHLTAFAKGQSQSRSHILFGVDSRRHSIVNAVIQLLGSDDSSDETKILNTIDLVLQEHGLQTHDTSAQTEFREVQSTESFISIGLTTKMEQSRDVRVVHRRHAIRDMVQSGRLGIQELDAHTNTAISVCIKWGLGKKETSALIFGNEPTSSTPDQRVLLFERISYIPLIDRLLDNVQQGHIDRVQDWIRRAMPVFGGRRPLDMMKDGPTGSAEIMEYLQHVLNGGS